MRRVVGEIGSMKFDARTRLEFDSLDNFSRFDSTVAINEVSSVLELHGKVNGAFLELQVKFGEIIYEPRIPIANQAALSEALSGDNGQKRSTIRLMLRAHRSRPSTSK
jgi:hypothetical protein